MRKLTNQIIHTVFLIGLCCGLTAVAEAAVFQVNSNSDDQTDGCGAVVGTCTLREAVAAANADPALDTVTFAPSITVVTLTAGEIVIANDIEISPPMTATAVVTIQSAGVGGRIFNIAAGADTTLGKLALADGLAEGNGGAILNNGAVLTINDSVIRNNEATAGSMGSGFGGGIYTSGGTVNINRSTIGGAGMLGNRAAAGGGIYNLNGTVNLTNSTVTNNFSGGIGGGYYGFADIGAAMLTSISNTIAFNTATNGGGIAVSSLTGFQSRVTINNTIVAKNNAVTGPDVSDNPPVALGVPGIITSTGYNIVGNTSGATIVTTNAVGDQFNINPTLPLLLPLANNGGFTPTHALEFSANNPAIDKGNTQQTEDQRGFSRNDDFPGIPNAPGGNGTDIGAFEVQIGVTAAAVTVVGRVVTSSSKGVSRARVSITDSNGATRITSTNFFGYFRFEEVTAGETYIFNVSSKSHSFRPQVVTVNEELTDLNFVAEP